MTNLVARNKEVKSEILHCLAEVFPSLLSIPIPEDINEVLVGLLSKTTVSDFASCQEVQDVLVRFGASVSKNSVSDAVNSVDLVKEWTSLLSDAKLVQL